MGILVARLLPAFMLLLGACFFALSFIPYEWAAAWVLDSQQGSSAASFSSRFSAIQEKLKFLSCTLLILAFAARQARQIISHCIDKALVPLPRLIYSAFKTFVIELRHEQPLVFVALAGITLIGLALRMHFLFDPIEFDEADTLLSYASRPLLVGMSWYAMPNNHILHTVLLHFVSMVFGQSEWAVRLPALAAGMVLIPLTYALGKQFFDSNTGLIAACLVACTSSMVSYSVNGRGYTILCVFTCLLWITARSLLRESSPPKWLALSIWMALGFYTIPVFLYPAAAVILWLAVSSTTHPPALRRMFLLNLASAASVGAALTLLLYLPVILTIGYKSLLLNPYVAPKTWTYFIEAAPDGFRDLLLLLAGDFPLPICIVLAAGLLIGLRYRWTGNGYVFPPLVAILGTGLLLVILQRVVPFSRVWTFLVPQMAVAAGSGLSLAFDRFRIRVPQFAISVLSLALALACFTWHGDQVRRAPATVDSENLAVWLKEKLGPADIVAVEMTAGFPLAYYMARHNVPWKRSPAACDAMSLFFKPKADVARVERIFAVTTEGRQTLERVLSTICFDLRTSEAPKQVYRGQKLSVHLLNVPPESTLARH
jgi:uncharacterized membrane protein